MPPAYMTSNYGQSQALSSLGNVLALAPAGTDYNNGALGVPGGDIIIKSAGVYNYVGIRIIANTTTTAIFTLASLKNSSLGNISFSVGPGLTGFFQDITNSDSVGIGDVYTFRCVTTFEWFKEVDWTVVQFVFTADDPDETVTRIVTEEQGVWPLITAANNYYFGIFCQLPYFANNFPTTVTATLACVPYDCTVRNAYITIPSNSADASTTVTLQKNTADTSITMTVGAGLTGTFEDTTHTVAYLTDDTINWHINAALTSGTFYITRACMEFVSAESKWISAIGQQTRTFTGPSTTSFNIGGMSRNAGLTALENSNIAPLNGSCLGLCINVIANVTSGNSYLSWYTNEVQGNNIVTIGATLTGFFDFGATDDFSIGDQLNIYFAVATGTLEASNITWVGAIQAAPGTGSIVVTKTTVPVGDDEVFNFTATGMTPSSFSLSDGESQAFNDLAIGSGYGVAEAAASGWTTSIEVSNDDDPDDISVGDGETVIVTVTNTRVAGAGSGIYKIVPQKRDDTIYLNASVGTEQDVKIPDPFIDTAFIGD